jgi:hypothetical protein
MGVSDSHTVNHHGFPLYAETKCTGKCKVDLAAPHRFNAKTCGIPPTWTLHYCRSASSYRSSRQAIQLHKLFSAGPGPSSHDLRQGVSVAQVRVGWKGDLPALTNYLYQSSTTKAAGLPPTEAEAPHPVHSPEVRPPYAKIGRVVGACYTPQVTPRPSPGPNFTQNRSCSPSKYWQ